MAQIMTLTKPVWCIVLSKQCWMFFKKPWLVLDSYAGYRGMTREFIKRKDVKRAAKEALKKNQKFAFQ
jgi:hypothetical protein